MKNEVLISIIISTRDKPWETLRVTLDSIFSSTSKDFEIIVVDQNSNSAIRSEIQSDPKYSGIIYISSDDIGLSRGRNAGIKRANGSWLLFFDDDAIMPPDTLSAIYPVLRDNRNEPMVYCGEILRLETKKLYLKKQIAMGRRIGLLNFDSVCSIALMFNKNVILEIGLFDVNFGAGVEYGAGEESDIILRTLRYGFNIEKLDNFIVYHPDSGTSDISRRESYGMGTGALYKKHIFSSPQFFAALSLKFAAELLLRTLMICRHIGTQEFREYHINYMRGFIKGFIKYKSNASFRIIMLTGNERGSPLARYLDLLLGVPIIFFLQFFKNSGTLGNINKIAILQTAAIGDTVLMSAAITNLRNSYKDAVIDVFCGASNADAVRLIDGIDNVIVIPVKHPFRSIKSIREKGEYDIWFDFGPWPRINAVYSFFSLSRFTVGFNTKGQYRHFVYNRVVPHSSSIHEIDNQLNLVGNDPVREVSIISPNVTTDNKLIVFHPFPGGSKLHLKKWPDSRWNKLAEFLLNKGYHIKVTGGQENNLEARQMFQDIASRPEFEIVAGDLSLQETVKLLKTARLVISVDTGVMHLASALGVDLIALHGPTSPERWGPLHKNSIAILDEIECSPCLSLGFESNCIENRCMKNISVEAVIEAAEKFLLPAP